MIEHLVSCVVVGLVASAGFAGPPLKVCMVSGSFEYESDASLEAFKGYLEREYNAECVLLKANGWTDLPGLEALEDCDVALFFTRRLRIDGEQLDRVKRYCSSGRPVVAVRTASHGFQNWLEMDQEVLGGNYHDHYGNGPTYRVRIPKDATDHPVLDGVPEIKSRHSLYKNEPISEDAEILMKGYLPKHTEPVTWVREYKGARVFYTSLGGQSDFEGAGFRRLLANALFWTAKRPIEHVELPPLPAMPPKMDGMITLPVRGRVKSDGKWTETVEERNLPVAKTAILICDMWDKHWCTGANERCRALVEKMNPVINLARDKGVQVIHAPSDTLGFYAESMQRRRAMAAPAADPPDPIEFADPPLPIDDSDGGCDTPGDTSYSAWTRQHPLIEIGDFDIISDNGGEIYNFMQQQGIRNIIFVGVHVNMCVLGRSFGIKQMRRWGVECVLVRDLTDAMYDPKDPPHVTHDEGTQLVVEHIEKHWCPSTTSEALVAALED